MSVGGKTEFISGDISSVDKVEDFSSSYNCQLYESWYSKI